MLPFPAAPPAYPDGTADRVIGSSAFILTGFSWFALILVVLALLIVILATLFINISLFNMWKRTYIGQEAECVHRRLQSRKPLVRRIIDDTDCPAASAALLREVNSLNQRVQELAAAAEAETRQIRRLDVAIHKLLKDSNQQVRARRRPRSAINAYAAGSIFIGVLFAAVVTKTLELSTSGGTTGVGKLQLVLAATLTIASWIGYHNSRNRFSQKIHFFNLPLAAFVIEMVLVYLYWLMAAMAEQGRVAASAVPEAVLLVIVFGAYISWDQVALAMRKSHRYPHLDMRGDQCRRRYVTFVFFVVLVIMVPFALALRTTVSIVIIDIAYIVFLVGHRATQHYLED